MAEFAKLLEISERLPALGEVSLPGHDRRTTSINVALKQRIRTLQFDFIT